VAAPSAWSPARSNPRAMHDLYLALARRNPILLNPIHEGLAVSPTRPRLEAFLIKE